MKLSFAQRNNEVNDLLDQMMYQSLFVSQDD